MEAGLLRLSVFLTVHFQTAEDAENAENRRHSSPFLCVLCALGGLKNKFPVLTSAFRTKRWKCRNLPTAWVLQTDALRICPPREEING